MDAGTGLWKSIQRYICTVTVKSYVWTGLGLGFWTWQWQYLQLIFVFWVGTKYSSALCQDWMLCIAWQLAIRVKWPDIVVPCAGKKGSRPACLQWASWLTLECHPRNPLQSAPETHTRIHQCSETSAVKPTLTCHWAGICICFPVLFQAAGTNMWFCIFLGRWWLRTGANSFDSSFFLRNVVSIVSIFLCCLWPVAC